MALERARLLHCPICFEVMMRDARSAKLQVCRECGTLVVPRGELDDDAVGLFEEDACRDRARGAAKPLFDAPVRAAAGAMDLGFGAGGIRVEVPGLPPSVNRQGRLTSEDRKWIEQARQRASEARAGRWIMTRREEKVALWLWFYLPKYGNPPDSHNLLKKLIDVWTGILWEDDFMVLPRIADIAYSDDPRVVVVAVRVDEGVREEGA